MIERVPRLAERLLTWSLAESDREAVLGDLCEEFAVRAARDGIPAARRWYWRQVRRSLPANLRRRFAEPDQNRSGNVPPHGSAGEGMVQDLRYGIRALLKARAFTVVVVLTLALGIGATTAIFSVVDAVLLKPLPYPEPDRIISFAWRTASGVSPANVTPLTFDYWRQHARAFESFAVTSGASFTMVRDGAVERLTGIAGTCDFFKVFGVWPALGRGFMPHECVPGAPPVAVISHGLWLRHFGGRSDAIGKSITLNDRSYTVTGVMPPGFTYEPDADLWYPLQLQADPRDAGLNYAVAARLLPAVSLEQAQSETDLLFHRFHEANQRHVPRGARTIGLIRLQDFLIADMRPLLLVLLGAVGLVLLIACGNVANLLLSRSTTRARDMAIRTALGAGRGRLARQTIVECLLLSLTGGVAGAALASAGVRGLVAAMPDQSARLGTVAVDYRVLGFALLISVALGLIFGIAGSLRGSSSDPGTVLKAATGTGIDVPRHRLSSALVVVEVALSVILLVGAGLLVATFVNLRSVRVGFDTDNVLAVQLFPSVAKYGQAAAGTVLDRHLIDTIAAVPGVTSVTTASSLPLERGPNFIFSLEGDPPDKITYVELRAVGAGYLTTLGIPLRAGRELGVEDIDNSLPAVIVNETLARRFGDPAGALGQRIVIGRGTPGGGGAREIVGVAADVADGRPGTRVFPTIYLPRTQFASGANVNILIRASEGVQIAADVRRAVLAVDPQLPIGRIRWMNDVAWQALTRQRFNMMLTGVFAATALALAMIGLYGLLSYQVTQRTREIGVRIALGARRVDVLVMIVRRGLALTALGLFTGATASLGLARLLKTLLYGVTATSPWVYATVAVTLLAVALLASMVPARRAMRADPLTALRAE